MCYSSIIFMYYFTHMYLLSILQFNGIKWLYSADRQWRQGVCRHAWSYFWPMLYSNRSRYSNRAVTFISRFMFISFWNYTILFVITQKIALNTSLELFLPGKHDHNTLCWLTLCTINDTAECILLVLCICVSASVCVCWGRGCMFAMSASTTGPLYGVID